MLILYLVVIAILQFWLTTRICDEMAAAGTDGVKVKPYANHNFGIKVNQVRKFGWNTPDSISRIGRRARILENGRHHKQDSFGFVEAPATCGFRTPNRRRYFQHLLGTHNLLYQFRITLYNSGEWAFQRLQGVNISFSMYWVYWPNSYRQQKAWLASALGKKCQSSPDKLKIGYFK